MSNVASSQSTLEIFSISIQAIYQPIRKRAQDMSGTKSIDSTDSSTQFEIDASRGFAEWLAEKHFSLALTTYQAGKIVFLGANHKGNLWIHNRNIGRCLGMAVNSNSLWIASDSQLYRFQNILDEGVVTSEEVDTLYAPRLSFFTGDLDIHDIALDSEDQPVFVNTLFNCLARTSNGASFQSIWKPPFITKLIAEDRCHLNGLAMRDGLPAYVTASSKSDVFDGWRDHRESGGIVLDVTTDEVVCDGLSMPHSPRWHDGKLWLHNSGKGEFGYVDFTSGQFEPVAFCPGYLRGLDFFGSIAVVTLSLPRSNKTFSGLPIEDRLQSEAIAPRCGIYFIDLNTGGVLHSLVIHGVVTELYDVAILKGIRKPAAISPLSNDIKRVISASELPTI